VGEAGLYIGIDARELTGRPTGVGRYLSGLLREWAASNASTHRFTLFVPASPPEWVAALGPRVAIAVERAATAGTWWEQMRLPSAARRAGVHVWFSPGYSAPLRLPCPSVVAIHDLSFFAHPEWFSWREGMRRRWLARAAARRAHAVVTISEFSAAELVRWLDVPRERIRLAPPGIASASSAAFPPPPRPPIVLFVGSLFNRRRIPEMLRAFAAVSARVPRAQLILVGDNRTRPEIDPIALARELGIERQVEWRAYVSDADLSRLYASARVFLFLSEYEGFAMTPLEALAHGVPAILLDTAVAREVYGAGATLVGDAAALEAALVRLLTDDAAHSAALTAGRALLTRYSWARSAALVLEALAEAAAQR
jgi:glycosyltransferase involved in cell wall biosynthesis